MGWNTNIEACKRNEWNCWQLLNCTVYNYDSDVAFRHVNAPSKKTNKQWRTILLNSFPIKGHPPKKRDPISIQSVWDEVVSVRCPSWNRVMLTATFHLHSCWVPNKTNANVKTLVFSLFFVGVILDTSSLCEQLPKQTALPADRHSCKRSEKLSKRDSLMMRWQELTFKSCQMQLSSM